MFFSPGGDYTWAHLVNSVIEHCRHQSSTVAVDFSGLDYLAEGFAPRALERLLGVSRPRILGPSTTLLPPSRSVRVSSDVMAELQISLDSAVMSLLRTTRKKGPKANTFRRKYIRSSFSIYQATKDFIRNCPRVKRVVVPNGRFPQQRAIAIAARELGVDVMYYERSSDFQGFFLQPFMTSSIAARSEVLAELGSPDTESLDEVQEKLDRRLALEDSSNPFARRWTKDVVFADLDKAAVYFSSSQDEFWALGPEWAVDFESQYACLAEYLRANQDVKTLVIRMHPNTLNKSLGYALDEIREVVCLSRIFAGKLRVIAPHLSTNSYALAAGCQRVIVWNSTIGLESLYLGKDVAFLAPTQFASYLGLSSPEGLEVARGTLPKSEVLDYLARSELLFSKGSQSRPQVLPDTTRGRILHVALSRPFTLWLLLITEILTRWAVRVVFTLANQFLWLERRQLRSQ